MTAESATREDIASVTAEYLAGELKIPTGEIAATDVLRDLPGADSMKMLRVVAKLERRWDVEFEDEEIFAVKTVDELVTLVRKGIGGDLAES
ncbi:MULTISPECIES: acyl carrier protein [unclassified Amycolatopsis]|uniref:acyl carrier protein n=1 Tax=unclassified Amycolatopsis TaxID=2618356 RepID=UPI002E163AF8|nr:MULTISPECIES: acyl carrier protein [unclassified Amycolatopsis]WSJ80918.1 acyl carrier protein [Amycolatopsis sp. NBC_01307]WSK75643.1 acyl carrier protein [Amycolatopsis sp. NBC_01286]